MRSLQALPLRVRVDLRVMTIKRYSTFSKAPGFVLYNDDNNNISRLSLF